MATRGDLRTVDLVQAFLWTCDECGRDNFERAITLDPESIDVDSLPETAGLDAEMIREWIDSGGEGDFVCAPGSVTCKHCGSTFSVAAS